MSKEIQDKLKEVDARFKKTQAEAQVLQEKVNEENRQLQVYKEELIRLQGEHRALSELLPKEKTKK